MSFARRPPARPRRPESVVFNAYSLVLNVILTSGTGVLFWVVAARVCSPEEVGEDGALISAMLLIVSLLSLNLVSAILRFLPVVRTRVSTAILGSYALAGTASGVGAVAFVVLAPRLDSKFGFLATHPGLAVLFVFAVLAWSVFALQDAVLTAFGQSHWVAVENGAFGLLKLAVLPVAVLAALTASHAIFVSWMLPMVVLLVPVNWAIFRRFAPHGGQRGDDPTPVGRVGRRGLANFMAQDYGAPLRRQAANTFLPILVVALLGTRQGARFYIPFTIVNSVDLLFFSIAMPLTVEGAKDPARLGELVRTLTRRFSWLLALAVIVLVAAGYFVLLPYGTGYARTGDVLIRVLALASPVRAVVSLTSAIWRVEGHADRILALQALNFALVIPLTVILGDADGLTGAGLAWLIANATAGLFVLPTFVRMIRAPRPAAA